MPYSYPRATFTGAFGDNATGTWHPAQATIDQGYVTLWVMSQAGWVQRFSLPATQVTVKSAAQRITLVAGGQSFPILADPSAVNRALGGTPRTSSVVRSAAPHLTSEARSGGE